MATLAQALTAAIQRAQEVVDTYPEDKYGTCNFDSAYISAKRNSAKMRERIEAMGFRADYRKGWGFLLSPQGLDYPRRPEWKGCFHARKTAVAEAIAKTLKDNGVKAGVFYKMD